MVQIGCFGKSQLSTTDQTTHSDAPAIHFVVELPMGTCACPVGCHHSFGRAVNRRVAYRAEIMLQPDPGVISLLVSLTSLPDRMTELLGDRPCQLLVNRQTPGALMVDRSIRRVGLQRLRQARYKVPRFSLTVSLTATFSPLAGVGFGFPPSRHAV